MTGVMTRAKIESTAWAKAFKAGSPVSYQEAIEYAMEDRLEVLVERTNENGLMLWAIRVFDEPDFWMDAKPTKKSAISLCKEMGWKVQ